MKTTQEERQLLRFWRKFIFHCLLEGEEKSSEKKTIIFDRFSRKFAGKKMLKIMRNSI